MRSDRFDHLIRQIATCRVQPSRLTTPPCTSPDDFCPEGGIVDPRITTVVTATVEGCLAGDTACAVDDDCCSGVCTTHGRCGCFDTGHLCPNDGYCCSGTCVNHRCI